MFKNYIKIKFISGNGGNGSICNFKKNNKIILFSGGNGGRGGNIYLLCDKNLIFFNPYFYNNFYKSKNGASGSCLKKYGKNSKDLIIRIPFMSKIIFIEKNIFLYKCINDKDLFLLCKGGKGGIGLKNYNKEKINILKLNGKIGDSKYIKLEFSYLCNIIFIGFPNTGKSSFINNIFSYNLKFSNYKFTTIIPNLIYFNLYKKKIIIIDIPGLIKNSFNNYFNLYFNFFKNLYNLKIIFHFLDLSLLNINFKLLIYSFKIINNLLYKYNKNIFYKFRLIFLNKYDLINLNYKKIFIKKIFNNIRWYNILIYSSSYFNNIKYLINFITLNF